MSKRLIYYSTLSGQSGDTWPALSCVRKQPLRMKYTIQQRNVVLSVNPACSLFSSFVRIGVWFCSPCLPCWRTAPYPAKLPASCTPFSTRKQTTHLRRAFCARESGTDADFCVHLQAKIDGSAASTCTFMCVISRELRKTQKTAPSSLVSDVQGCMNDTFPSAEVPSHAAKDRRPPCDDNPFLRKSQQTSRYME